VVFREIIAYKEYFQNFYNKQEAKVQLKIEYVLDLVRQEKHVPSKFFKYLVSSDGIYEIRVVTTFKSIRILCFMDNDNLIILVNGFYKKSRKTPAK